MTVNFFQPKLENSLKRFKIQFYIRLDQFLFSDHRILPKNLGSDPLNLKSKHSNLGSDDQNLGSTAKI